MIGKISSELTPMTEGQLMLETSTGVRIAVEESDSKLTSMSIRIVIRESNPKLTPIGVRNDNGKIVVKMAKLRAILSFLSQEEVSFIHFDLAEISKQDIKQSEYSQFIYRYLEVHQADIDKLIGVYTTGPFHNNLFSYLFHYSVSSFEGRNLLEDFNDYYERVSKMSEHRYRMHTARCKRWYLDSLSNKSEDLEEESSIEAKTRDKELFRKAILSRQSRKQYLEEQPLSQLSC